MMREIPDLFRAQTYERSRILGTRSGDGSFFLGLPSGNFAMVCDGVGENPSNSFIKSHLKLDPGMDATPMDVRSSRWMEQVCKEIIDSSEFIAKYEAVVTLDELIALNRQTLKEIIKKFQTYASPHDLYLVCKLVGSFFLTKESVGTVGLTYGDVFTFDSGGQIISAQNNYFDSQKAEFQKDYNQTCSDTLWDDLSMAILQIMPLVKKLADPKNREEVFISALELELKKRSIQIDTGFLIAFKQWLRRGGINGIFNDQHIPTILISSRLSDSHSKYGPKLYSSPIVQDIIMTTDGIEDGIQITDQDKIRWLLIDYPSIISHILLFQKSSLTTIKPDDILCLAVSYLRTIGGTEFDNP